MILLPANLNITNYDEIKTKIESILEKVGFNYINITNITFGELALLMSYILFPNMDTIDQIFDIYNIYIYVLKKLNINPEGKTINKSWQWGIGIEKYIIELLIQQLLINDEKIGRIKNEQNKKWPLVKKAMLYLQLLNIILKHTNDTNSKKLVSLENFILNKYKK